ncbi:hypothetical protein BC826DRAFT_1051045 [Russula brevipes]|nr:hypothetical protein BC826DRAFT_1051045 [Russula brevipes]
MQLQKEKHEHVPIKEPVTKRRVHFNEDPVAEVHSMRFPASSTSSLVSSSGSSTPSPLPHGAFPQRSDPSPQQQPQAPSLSPKPKPSVSVPVPPPSRVSDVSIHWALATPSLSYDVRLLPSQYNPSLSPAILGAVASIPPLPYLTLRIDDLPWRFSVFPDAALSRDRKGVTIQDVLLGIYHQLRVAVKSDEYEAMSKYKKEKIFQAFERRVGTDPVQRGAGLRRIDCLGGRHIAQGLIHAESQNRIWTVVVQDRDVPPNGARPSSSRSELEPTASMPGSMSAELEAWSFAIQQFLKR